MRVPASGRARCRPAIIDQRVGRGAVLKEAVKEAHARRAYSTRCASTSCEALGQPEIEVTKFDDGEPLGFTAEVDVRPEIDPAGARRHRGHGRRRRGHRRARSTSRSTALRERFAHAEGRRARRPQDGDYVSLDLTATVDGEEVAGGSASGLSYEVGIRQLLIDGLDEAIVGVERRRRPRRSPPRWSRASTPAARPRSAVTVRSVKEKELPELDDEFAQLASEFDTLDELRADLRSRLDRVKALEQGAQARDKVLEALLEQTEVPLPESAVHGRGRVARARHRPPAGRRRRPSTWNTSPPRARPGRSSTAELREDAEKSVQDPVHPGRDRRQGGGAGVRRRARPSTSYRRPQRYHMPPQEFANQIIQAGNLPAPGGRRAAQQGAGHGAGVGDDHRRVGRPGRPGRTCGCAAGRARATRPTAEADGRARGRRRGRGRIGRPRSARSGPDAERLRRAANSYPSAAGTARARELGLTHEVGNANRRQRERHRARSADPRRCPNCEPAGAGMNLNDSVYDRLLRERIIFLGQQVDDTIANQICAQLLLLAAEDPERDINLYINSPGGSVTAGMAIFDTMQLVECDVATYAMGLAASMGQFLLSAGTRGKRYALPHARILMHQPSAGIGGTASDIAIQAEQCKLTKREMAELIAEHTGQTVEQIEKDSDRDRWFTAAGGAGVRLRRPRRQPGAAQVPGAVGHAGRASP